MSFRRTLTSLLLSVRKQFLQVSELTFDKLVESILFLVHLVKCVHLEVADFVSDALGLDLKLAGQRFLKLAQLALHAGDAALDSGTVILLFRRHDVEVALASDFVVELDTPKEVSVHAGTLHQRVLIFLGINSLKRLAHDRNKHVEEGDLSEQSCAQVEDPNDNLRAVGVRVAHTDRQLVLREQRIEESVPKRSVKDVRVVICSIIVLELSEIRLRNDKVGVSEH